MEARKGRGAPPVRGSSTGRHGDEEGQIRSVATATPMGRSGLGCRTRWL